MSLVSLEQPSQSGKQMAAHLHITELFTCCCHSRRSCQHVKQQSLQHDIYHSFASLQAPHVSTSLASSMRCVERVHRYECTCSTGCAALGATLLWP